MKIIKYEKKANGKYRIYLDNNEKVDLCEDTILKNKLLYKKELTSEELYNLTEDNIEEDIYNRCVKYICGRLRSTKEIHEYIKKYTEDTTIIENIISKLVKNNLLNDLIFAKAFVKDKFKFTTMGPRRIETELRHNNIDDNIIYESMNEITPEEIDTKIEHQINKIIKSNHSKPNLRNRIYTNLVNLGYKEDMILSKLNKFIL